MLGQSDIDRLKKKLVAERRALTDEDAAHAANRDPVELDQTRQGRLPRMDALQQQAMANAAHARTELRLKRIDAALERIDEGEYGFCQRCGDDIDVRRIEADPATATCIDCADPGRRH